MAVWFNADGELCATGADDSEHLRRFYERLTSTDQTMKREMSAALKAAYAAHSKLDLELADTYAQQNALRMKIRLLVRQVEEARQWLDTLRKQEGFT